MENDLIHINHWLRPLSWLYGLGVGVRNWLFDTDILKQKAFDCPVVNVGNLTVGGTGKTPHIELLIRMLKNEYHVAVLSRGYKRKSRGYLLADVNTPVQAIGDEPWQLKKKFPDVAVAVDANRQRGITHLLNDEPQLGVNLILLDDAFQHRYVRPRVNILLTDYHRLISEDRLLPAGRLREPIHAKNRADIVIVTKCPHDIRPIDYRVVQSSLNLKPFQQLFFSTFRYGTPYRLFNETPGAEEQLTSDTHVLLLTGIASPRQMMFDLHRITRHITPLFFPDHHEFSPHDINQLEHSFADLQGSKRLIITTEKDAARLLLIQNLSPIIRRHLYVLPIEVEILRNQQPEFRQTLQKLIHTSEATI